MTQRKTTFRLLGQEISHDACMTYQMLLQLRGSDVADEYLRAMQQKRMLEDLKKAQDFVGPPNLGSELKARASEKKLRLPKTELPEGYGTGGRISLI